MTSKFLWNPLNYWINQSEFQELVFQFRQIKIFFFKNTAIHTTFFVSSEELRKNSSKTQQYILHVNFLSVQRNQEKILQKHSNTYYIYIFVSSEEPRKNSSETQQ